MQIEAYVHKILSRYPRLKNIVKVLYQFFFMAFSKSDNTSNSSIIASIPNAFGGFHDIVNVDISRSKILYHRSMSTTRQKIDGSEFVEIVEHDYNTGKHTVLDKTFAFNWQMGSRLQYICNEIAIWNTIRDNKLQSTSYFNGQFRQHPFPIYSASNSGIIVTSNFQHIENNMAGYGYVGKFEQDCGKREVVFWDYLTDTELNRIEIDKILSVQFTTFISHFQFSNCGKFLAFFVRTPSHRFSFHTRLVIMRTSDCEIICEVEQTNIITHFCWMNDTIIFFGLLNNTFKYLQLNIFEKSISVPEYLTGLPDGHPQFCPKHGIITDTYPDRHRIQRLYQIAPNGATFNTLYTEKIPLKFRNYSRVDFHPRYVTEGYVSLDTVTRNRITTLLLRIDS